MQQNLDNSSFWRRWYVRVSIAFMVTCLVVALALVIKLVILSKDAKHDMSELPNNQTTQDNDSNRSTLIVSTVEDPTSHVTTISSANHWTIDSYLISKRAHFAAVVLENGEVLVSGGTSSNYLDYGEMSSSEIYSPLDRKWRAVTDMLTERSSHTLTILQNRRSILAIGCANFIDSHAAEIYDIEMNRWSYVPSIMDVGRYHHTATLLRGGQVLIVGEIDMSELVITGNVQLYDPRSNTFITTGSLNAPRQNHIATLLKDGLRVLVTGGNDHFLNTISTAEVYASNSWRYTQGNMMVARQDHATVLLPNGNVLIVGGSDTDRSALLSAEIYDTITDTFSLTKSMACARWKLTLTLLPSGKVLAAGGMNQATDECLRVSELYDPITGKWKSTRLLNTVHFDHATVLLNNSVLLMGGLVDPYSRLHECERYDL